MDAQSELEKLGGAIIGVSLLLTVLFIAIDVMIIKRAGYSGWWILIGLIPVVNFVMILIFAFKEWPVQRELRELRDWAGQVQRQAAATQTYPPANPSGTAGYGYSAQ